METEIKSLLEQVSVIVKKYDDLAAKTGENFNIFSVLKLDSDEVRLHSRLLGELLNPRGSHGQNELFLKLFISTIGLENHYQNDSLLKEGIVLVEENIGNLPDDYSKGGRIDIVIKFPSLLKEIVIENKIYAPDQKNQLGRYYTQYQNANIIYLTRIEKQPSDDSLGDKLKLDSVKCITYKIQIKEWLEKCLEKTVEHPLLRETLIQYLYLIKKLTNQTPNDNMKMELAKMIALDPTFIKSAEVIAGVWDECRFQIIKSLECDIREVARQLKLECKIDENLILGEAESGFWFYKAEWRYCIYFYFESRFDNILVGIDHVDNKDKCEDETVSDLTKYLLDFRVGNKKDYSNWIWVSDFSQWENTNWSNIKSEIPNAILETTKIILEKLEGFTIRN
jgi:hypothetical protein